MCKNFKSQKTKYISNSLLIIHFEHVQKKMYGILSGERWPPYMTLQAVYKSQHDLRCRAESYIQLRNTFSCVRDRGIKQNISEAFTNGAF